MNAIERISSSISEPWVAWMMLFLLCMLCLANTLQQGMFVNSFRTLRNAKERDNMFDITQSNILGKVFLYVYKVGVLAFALYTILPHEGFYFSHFLCLAGVVIVFLLGKFILSRFLAYVFFTPHVFRVALHHYVGLTNCCTLLLYPILLLALFVPNLPQIMPLILYAILLLFFTIVLIIKIFQLFFTQPLASLHIFLYLCTLEALPLIALFCVGASVIN